MYAKGSNVGSGLAGNPEDSQLAIIVELNQLTLVNCSDTKLSLHGRDEWGALEECTCERLQRACQLCSSTRELVVEPKDCNVFLSGTLLTLHQSRGTVNADDQAACDLWIEGTGVTGAVDTKDAFEPRDYLV